MRIQEIINESLNSPYRYKKEWVELDSEEYNDGEYDDYYPQPGEKMAPLQTAKFTTDDGTQYLWYARQNRYEPSWFEVAFGVIKGTGFKDETQLDITKTNTGDQYRVFATVINILDDFVGYFEDDVMTVSFTADKEDGQNRTGLYKRLVDKYMPYGFKLKEFKEDSSESYFVLSRYA